MTFDLERVRSAFPALATTDNGTPRIYLDNPAGTQVPLSVANAMSDCLLQQQCEPRRSFCNIAAPPTPWCNQPAMRWLIF